MDKVKPEKITVALTLDQVDVHNNNYNALANKDLEIYNSLVEQIQNSIPYEKAVVIEDISEFKIYINPTTPVTTAFTTQQEAIDFIKTLKFTFIPADSCNPTDVKIVASYLENNVPTFFLYTAPFNGDTLFNNTHYTIIYSEDESTWLPERI